MATYQHKHSLLPARPRQRICKRLHIWTNSWDQGPMPSERLASENWPQSRSLRDVRRRSRSRLRNSTAEAASTRGAGSRPAGWTFEVLWPSTFDCAKISFAPSIHHMHRACAKRCSNSNRAWRKSTCRFLTRFRSNSPQDLLRPVNVRLASGGKWDIGVD